MAMIFATVMGCILCFMCGAGVVYGREYLLSLSREEKDSEPEELSEKELRLQEQWAELLDYRGDAGKGGE